MSRFNVLFMGAVAIFAALLASWNDYAVVWLLLIATVMFVVGLLDRSGTYVQYYGWTYLGRNLLPQAFSILTIGLAMMPTDGSSLLVAVNLMATICALIATSVAIYAKDACTCERIVWKDIARIAGVVGLPVIGMILIQYEVQTDRQVWTGCIALIVLTALGRWATPAMPFQRQAINRAPA